MKSMRIGGIPALLLAVMFLGACNLGGSGDDGPTSPPPPPSTPTAGGSGLKFNITGAKTIAAGGSSTTASFVSRSMGESPLVKIMEDGTVQSILQMDGPMYSIPSISFIYVGDDKSVYICFSFIFAFPNNIYVQFIRIKPDNTYEVLWPVNQSSPYLWSEGQVKTWSWAGMDMEPIIVGPDGKIYFMISKSSGGRSSEHIYAYDPAVGGKPVLRTPSNSEM
ncbi:MAG: hypothetical protein SNJ78_13165, partial [Spirochaetales bacterium]